MAKGNLYVHHRLKKNLFTLHILYFATVHTQ